MSHLGDEEVDSILARSKLVQVTHKTIVEPGLIRQAVAPARKEGFAMAIEESLIGEIALACAILDPRGRPIAAIHIAGSLSEWEPSPFAKRFAPLAIEAATALGDGAPYP